MTDDLTETVPRKDTSRLARVEARAEAAWDGLAQRARATRLGSWWKSTEKPGGVDWALVAVLLVVTFATFLYGDVRVTFEHSMNFLDAVFSGNLRGFYSIALDNASFGHPAVYDFPIYLVFGIWNLPTYVIHKITGFDYLHSLPAELWLKAMMVVFALIAAWLLIRIARTLGMTLQRSKWVAFYFLSSMSVVLPVFVIVQYDIVSVVFMLAGIHAYMLGKTRSFLLWFLAANTLKLFALFVFIPLVLLKEKRIPRAIAQIVVGVLGLALCKLVYLGDVAYKTSTGGFTEGMLSRLTATGFQWQYPGYTIGIFVVFIVGLGIFSYAKTVDSVKELRIFAVYLPLAAFLVFCAIVPLNPYWIVLVAPFAVLIVFANPRHFVLNSVLEVCVGAGLFVIYAVVGFSIYNNGMFTELVFGRLIPPASPQRFSTPNEILGRLGVSGHVGFLIAFMIACVIAVLILNYPRRSFIENSPNAEPIKRSVVWLRLLAPYGFVGLLFAMYLLPAPPTAYTTVAPDVAYDKVAVLPEGGAVSEEITFDSTITVAQFSVGVDASAVTWINTSTITLSILDADTDAVVYTSSVPANSVGSGLASFGAKGLELSADRSYVIEVSGSGSKTSADQNIAQEPAFVLVNPSQDRFPTMQDGDELEGDLVLTITGRESE